MTEEDAKNKDGFAPGQDLSFADLMAMRAAKAAAPAVPSREEIESMERDEVIGHLKASGVDDPKGKIADLRNRLVAMLHGETGE